MSCAPPANRGFAVGPHWIGPNADGYSRCFVIAEAGVNHNGDRDIAHKLVDIAAEAGADAVKFQTFKSDQLISEGAPKAAYQRAATGSGESQLEMIRALELGYEDFAQLQAHCAARGLIFLSTPFDPDSIDFLDRLGVPAFKVPSGEITNLALLSQIGSCGRPIILSTGMSTLREVQDALEVVERTPDPGIAILHCVSSYPTDPCDANLRAMETMREAAARPIGWSDHTTGSDITLAAVALGAAIVEKHFTLDKSLPGPDHAASLNAEELVGMIRGIRRVEAALGDGVKRPRPAEADTRRVARRSLFLRRGIEAGAPVTADALIAMRPGDGISPNQVDKVVGRRAVRPLSAGAKIDWPDLV